MGKRFTSSGGNDSAENCSTSVAKALGNMTKVNIYKSSLTDNANPNWGYIQRAIFGLRGLN